MASLILTDAMRSSIVDLVTTAIDGGTGAGKILIYDGTQPAGPGTAVTAQELLVEFAFDDPSFASASAGVAVGAPIANATAETFTGPLTATWARITDGDDTALFDCDVDTSNATINLNSTSIASGATVAITSSTLTMPSGA